MTTNDTNMHLSIVFNLNTIYSILLHFYITSFAILFANLQIKTPFTNSATLYLSSSSSFLASFDTKSKCIYKSFGLSFCTLNFVFRHRCYYCCSSWCVWVCVCICVVLVHSFIISGNDVPKYEFKMRKWNIKLESTLKERKKRVVPNGKNSFV